MDHPERLVNPLLSWWQEREPNQRLGIKFALAALGLLLVIVVFFKPAYEGRQRLEAALPGLRADLALMDGQASEARRLEAQGTLRTPQGDALRDALAASLREHGMATKALVTAGRAVRIELHDVAFADWVAWLDEVRTQLHVKVSEAHVSATKPGQVELTATLSPP
jgi:general secretion pathway protein M